MERESKRRKMDTNGTSTYSPFEIPFNPNPLRTPRKLRMVVVGAGFAGLTLIYKIQHEKKLSDIIDLTVYERLVSLRRILTHINPLTREARCWWHLAGQQVPGSHL